MRYFILTVGKTKETFYRDAINHYVKSIGHMAQVEYLEARDSGSDPEREAKSLLAVLEKRELVGNGRARIALLDVEGKSLDTEGWAKKLTQWRDSGVQTTVFVIGGAYGFPESFRRALSGAERLSLSPLTFPHELARVVLLEQVYRALHIQAGGKYHHS